MSDLRARFDRLVTEMEEETRWWSWPAIEHPAAKAIIAMGMPAVPWILEKLQRAPTHIYELLWQMVDDPPPIPKDKYGHVPTLIAAWLAWGRAKGYL